MSANACTGEEDLGGVGVFGGEAGGFIGTVHGGAESVPLLASRPWMVGGFPQQALLVRMDVELSPTHKSFGPLLSGVDAGMQSALGTSVERVFGHSSSSFSGRANPQEGLLVGEGEVPPVPPPSTP